MRHVLLLMVVLLIVLNPEISFSRELTYYRGFEEAIASKTQQIAVTYATDHDGLAQLYMTRGEFHLFCSQHQPSLDDFQSAYLHSQQISDYQTSLFSAFQALFGAAICYGNLEMHEAVGEAVQRLDSILDCMELCGDCVEQSPSIRLEESSSRFPKYNSLVAFCSDREDNYGDVAGPDNAPVGWCSECVIGIAKGMRDMIQKEDFHSQREYLLQIVQRMENQAHRCCRSGSFWKSCVAPIARKWKEWKDFQEMFGHMPLPPP